MGDGRRAGQEMEVLVSPLLKSAFTDNDKVPADVPLRFKTLVIGWECLQGTRKKEIKIEINK